MKALERQQYVLQIINFLRPRQVLEYYGTDIKNDKRKSKKSGGVEFDCVCPFHPSDTMNFSMSSETGRWLCRSAMCGKQGDLIIFVAHQEECSHEQAFRQLCFMADIEPTSIDNLSIALSMFETRVGGDIFSAMPTKGPSPIRLPRHYRVFAHPYMVNERLLDPDVLVASEVGGIYHDDFYKYRACVPVKRDGKVHSIYSRRVSDDVEAWQRANPKIARFVEKMFRKHDYTGNTLTSHLVYGLDDVEGPDVILVEAIISVLFLRSLGIYNAVALMKADLSSEQARLLIARGFSRIFICGDNDIKFDKDSGTYFNPGLKASWKNYHRLKNYADVGVVKLDPNRDPSDTDDPYTEEEFELLLSKTTFPKTSGFDAIKDWLPA